MDPAALGLVLGGGKLLADIFGSDANKERRERLRRLRAEKAQERLSRINEAMRMAYGATGDLLSQGRNRAADQAVSLGRPNDAGLFFAPSEERILSGGHETARRAAFDIGRYYDALDTQLGMEEANVPPSPNAADFIGEALGAGSSYFLGKAAMPDLPDSPSQTVPEISEVPKISPLPVIGGYSYQGAVYPEIPGLSRAEKLRNFQKEMRYPLRRMEPLGIWNNRRTR